MNKNAGKTRKGNIDPYAEERKYIYLQEKQFVRKTKYGKTLVDIALISLKDSAMLIATKKLWWKDEKSETCFVFAPNQLVTLRDFINKHLKKYSRV